MATNDNSRMIVLFIVGLFLIAITMISVIYVSTRRPLVVVVPGAGEQVAGPSVPGDVSTPALGESAAAPAPLPTVSVVRMETLPAVNDPLDPAWGEVSAFEIPLEMQRTSEPMLQTSTVSKVKLQAAYNNRQFTWRLSWGQPEPSFKGDVAEFSDAVALQFPLKDGAPYTMGGPEMPVAMMYWKALWQKDIDEGFQDVTDFYPNSWYDLYWFAEGTGPQPISTGFVKEEACPYMAGSAVGNPMSTVNRSQPVQELQAHGFGSSTDVPDSPISARGIWKDGNWHVVFARPNSSADPLVKRFFENPEQQLIALAVWDGQAQNRGGRKHITNWIPMRIEQ